MAKNDLDSDAKTDIYDIAAKIVATAFGILNLKLESGEASKQLQKLRLELIDGVQREILKLVSDVKAVSKARRMVNLENVKLQYATKEDIAAIYKALEESEQRINRTTDQKLPL